MNSHLSESYVSNQAELEQLCDRLKQSPYLALDTEFERSNTYYPILALMQIASEEESVLIDPLSINNWAPFAELLKSDVLIVMHSCSEDLEVFRRYFGTQPKHLIDTQIACAFAGKGDALGYANMVSAMRGVELDKSETRSDWLQRPLTDAQQEYAREDVRWLLGIYSELEAELEASGRLGWVQQECSLMRDKYLTEPGPEQQWLRIKGLGRTSPDCWPLAYALAEWRENLCRRLDKPRGWIMKDPELLEIATTRPRNAQQLSAIRNISSVTLKRNSRLVLELTNAEPLAEPPNRPVPELEPGQRALLKRLQKMVNDKSEVLALSARFLANKNDLVELIQYKQGRAELSSSILEGWR
ncbi:MAG: ribonuclease D, partial [Pseudomonadales bacterium]